MAKGGNWELGKPKTCCHGPLDELMESHREACINMAYYILHTWPVSTASDCGVIRRGSGSAQSSYALEYDLCFCWLSLVLGHLEDELFQKG
ncbi:hypothetical protein I7I48_10025 [Histoplasma ohiense]|nr:hypothetical protein I7I48_10025 [Histoplasma ohiense (nom. inval.)]